MFGQTCTASGDTMAQYRRHVLTHPLGGAWISNATAAAAWCPSAIATRISCNALQWAIGLELFLLVRDPWRIFLTTDHPNGAPFATYPHLIRLLMDELPRGRC